MLSIKLKVFGIYKDYFSSEMIINLPDGSDLVYFKNYLRKNLFVDDLSFLAFVLDKSMFSNNDSILSDNYLLKSGDAIFLLPPFSGG